MDIHRKKADAEALLPAAGEWGDLSLNAAPPGPPRRRARVVREEGKRVWQVQAARLALLTDLARRRWAAGLV